MTKQEAIAEKSTLEKRIAELGAGVAWSEITRKLIEKEGGRR